MLLNNIDNKGSSSPMVIIAVLIFTFIILLLFLFTMGFFSDDSDPNKEDTDIVLNYADNNLEVNIRDDGGYEDFKLKTRGSVIYEELENEENNFVNLENKLEEDNYNIEIIGLFEDTEDVIDSIDVDINTENNNEEQDINYEISVESESNKIGDNIVLYSTTNNTYSGDIEYNWDMGDGETYTDDNVIHTYTEPGNYTVELKVKNNDTGEYDTDEYNIDIDSKQPEARISILEDNPIENEEIEFNSNVNYGGDIVNYEWNFGDNNNADTEDATHTYTDSGEFEVELTVESEFGDEYTTNKIIDVREDKEYDLDEYPDDKQIIMDFMEGDGTESSPYEVTNIHELQAISIEENSNYIIKNDIDASYTQNWNNGTGFEPIEFTGELDGQNNTIDGLYINDNYEYTGIFSENNGNIENINLYNLTIKGDNSNSIGLITGYNDGIIENITMENSIIENETSIDEDTYIGSVSGTNENTVKKVKSEDIDIISERGSGGLIGYNKQDSTIKKSYSNNNIESEFKSGGLVSSNYGSISNSYSDGEITVQEYNSDNYIAGFIGWNGITGSTENTYTITTVNFENVDTEEIEEEEHGFININNNDQNALVDSYWNIDQTGFYDSNGGLSLFDLDMENESSKDNMNFDWDDTWEINEYPQLKWISE